MTVDATGPTRPQRLRTFLPELRELTRMRVLLFLREPEAVFWVIIFPLILAIVLGLAFRESAVETVRVAVVAGPGSDELMQTLHDAEHVKPRLVANLAAGELRLRHREVAALVERGHPDVIRFDPARPEGEIARLRIVDVLENAAGRVEPVEVKQEAMTEAGGRFIDWLIPGILGMNLMGTGIWSIGFAIAEARQRRLLRRLLVTPMRRSSFLLAFMLSRLVFLVLEVTCILAFAMLALGVPFRGTFASFAVICILGALSFAGLGVLLASRARTLEGVSGLMNLAMLPMWLCSGVFFSYHKFPEALQPLIRALPLTALCDALRSVMLDGTGLSAVGIEILVMLLWTAACFTIALRIFRWD